MVTFHVELLFQLATESYSIHSAEKKFTNKIGPIFILLVCTFNRKSVNDKRTIEEKEK